MPQTAPAAPALTKADYELLADFRYTLRKFLGFSEKAASEHGLTPQHRTTRRHRSPLYWHAAPAGGLADDERAEPASA